MENEVETVEIETAESAKDCPWARLSDIDSLAERREQAKQWVTCSGAKKDERKRVLCIVFYLDSTPPDILQSWAIGIREDSKTIGIWGALHNQDVLDDGCTPKKPHVHVVVYLKDGKTPSQWIKWLADVACPISVHKVYVGDDVRHSVRYLRHKDSPKKHQYGNDALCEWSCNASAYLGVPAAQQETPNPLAYYCADIRKRRYASILDVAEAYAYDDALSHWLQRNWALANKLLQESQKAAVQHEIEVRQRTEEQIESRVRQEIMTQFAKGDFDTQVLLRASKILKVDVIDEKTGEWVPWLCPENYRGVSQNLDTPALELVYN